MTTLPKQIIYPISYLRGMLGVPRSDRSAEFASTIQRYMGLASPAVPLGRARVGIYLLVKASLSAGRRKVVISSYTIPDVVHMIVLAGGQPVFVDVVEHSTNIDLDHLESLLQSDVACVVVTHYHVNQNEMPAIKKMCEQKSVMLFEDCAISLGGTIGGRHVGTDSDGGILSLSGYKFLNFFWGGVVFSSHKRITDALQEETAQWPPLPIYLYAGQVLKILRYDLMTRVIPFNWATFPVLKYRQRKTDRAVQLVIPRIESKGLDRTLMSRPHHTAYSEWLRKLPLVGQHLAHRRRIACVYAELLPGKMAASETRRDVFDSSCFMSYPIIVDSKARDATFKRLIATDVDVGLSLYPCCGSHPEFRNIAGKSTNTAKLERSMITLPTHPGITEDYARTVANAVRELAA